MAVIGQGPIGLLLMMLAREEGAVLMSSDPMPQRREKSRELGATISIDPAEGDLSKEVRQAHLGPGSGCRNHRRAESGIGGSGLISRAAGWPRATVCS